MGTDLIMRAHIAAMLDALSQDPIWLGWCREHLGAFPAVAFEPELPLEGVPDESYPFVWLYDARSFGPGSFVVELAVGVIDEIGHVRDLRASVLDGADVEVRSEYCAGLLLALDTWQAAANCLYRLPFGVQNADGESGSAVLHPYYEAWGSVSADWTPSTRKPLGWKP